MKTLNMILKLYYGGSFMKKLFISAIATIIYSQAFALCPINTEEENICSMKNFNNNISPIFKNNSVNPITEQTIQNSVLQLLLLENEQTHEQINLNNKNKNIDLNCQLGLCPLYYDNQILQK